MPTNPRNTADDDSDVEFEVELSPNRDPRDSASTARDPKQEKKAVQPEEVLVPQHKTVPPTVDPAVRQRYKARIFALKNNRTKKTAVNLAAAANRTYNYEEIYELDEYGKEAFPEARVWKVYNDETAIFDLDKIEAWRDALDVLLVFIGLFSAIVTTFVVQTSLALKPDYAQMTVIVTLEVLRTMTNTTTPNSSLQYDGSDPRFGEANPSPNDIAVNALWFTSLAVSLSTALLAVLTKQWLHHFTTSTSGTSRERSRIRQFRYAGLERYHVPLIIDLLPILLHISLAIFLAGLAVFLEPLHGVMFGVVVAVAGLAYLLYFASIVAPLIDYQCPYKSPLSFYVYQLHCLIMDIWVQSRTTLSRACEAKRKQPAAVGQSYLGRGPQTTPPSHHAAPSLREAEKSSVLRQGSQLDLDAIIWLYQTSANNTVRNISFEALGGLAPCATLDTAAACQFIDDNIHPVVGQWTEKSLFGNMVPRPGEEYRYDRLTRALCIGTRTRIRAASYLSPDDIYTREHNLQDHFSVAVVPAFVPYIDQSPVPVSSAFFPCGNRSHVIFPLPVWAAVLRLAKSLEPQTLSIKVGILSSLHLPIHGSDMGAVNLETALQHPEVRLLGAEYFGVQQLTPTNILSLIQSTLSLVLTDDASDCLALLSPLFKSFTSYPIEFYLDEKQTSAMRDIFTTFFESTHVDHVSWETFSYVTDTWRIIPSQTVDDITTPHMIRRIIEQLRQRVAPADKDIPWVEKAMQNLGFVFYGALDPKYPELARSACNDIASLNILPGRGDMESLRPFWTRSMCTFIVMGTRKLREMEYEWLGPWMEYVHTQERLLFLAKLLLTDQSYTENDSLQDLCDLHPAHRNWPACITSLIGLLQDQSYLDSRTGWAGSPVETPRRALSQRLMYMKETFHAYHDLTGAAFDIPLFDSHDNQIEPISREMVPPQLTDGLGSSFMPTLPIGQLFPYFPSIGTPADGHSPHTHFRGVDAQTTALDITSPNNLAPSETGNNVPGMDATQSISAEAQHPAGGGSS